MGRGSVWEGRVRLARREEGADPQRSVTDKQRRQRALPSQTLRAAGLSGLDCVGSGGTDRRRSAPPLTALPNPEFPSRRTPSHFQTGSQRVRTGGVVALVGNGAWALRAFRGNGRRVLPKGTVAGTGAGTTALRAGARLLVPTTRDDSHER